MLRTICLCLPFIAVTAWPTLSVAADRIVATLTPVEGSYLSGEPIWLRLAITNETQTAVSILADYPFVPHGAQGLRISQTKQQAREQAAGAGALSPTSGECR